VKVKNRRQILLKIFDTRFPRCEYALRLRLRLGSLFFKNKENFFAAATAFANMTPSDDTLGRLRERRRRVAIQKNNVCWMATRLRRSPLTEFNFENSYDCKKK
jgi:hypothetical protein